MDSKRSQNKQTFFDCYNDKKQEKPNTYQLTPADLPKLAAHYAKKYDIRIIPCAQTSFGKVLVEDMKKTIALIDSDLKYVKYFKELFLRRGTSIEFYERHHFRNENVSLFCKEKSELLTALDPYLHIVPEEYVVNRSVKYLTETKAREFDKFCEEKLFCKDKLKAAIAEYYSVKYVHGICQFENQFNTKRISNACSYSKVEKTLRPFVTTFEDYEEFFPYKLKWELSFNELKQFDTVCSEFPFKSKLDETIKSYYDEKLNTEIANCMLSPEQAIQEIKSIQADMKEGDIAGYIWMPRGVLADHAESLIVTKSKLINPIHFRSDKLLRTETVFLPQLESFVDVIEGPQYFFDFPNTPQSGIFECGTLGMLYLKEFLKNKAEQWHEFTLTFSFYENDNLKHFFLPSPHVLRYSQVSTYNAIVKALLEQKDFETIEIGKENKVRTLKVKTIKKTLEETIEKAKAKNETKLAEESKALLSKLKSFSEKWLQAYQVASQQRALMQADDKNSYLLYSTRRMQKLTEVKESKEPKGFLAT